MDFIATDFKNIHPLQADPISGSVLGGIDYMTVNTTPMFPEPPKQ